MCVYNASETIYNCLKNLERIGVDRIIILEGLWEGYPQECQVSTDGTQIQIAKFISETKMEFKYMILPDPIPQYKARQILLNQIPIGDWVIVADSDEMWKSTINLREFLLKSEENGYRVRYHETRHPEKLARPLPFARILRKVKGMHYSKNHRYMQIEGKDILFGNMPVIEGVLFRHDGAYKAMRPFMEEYKNFLLDWERNNAQYLENSDLPF